MVIVGCLIPKNFPGASKFLSVNGLTESPPLTVAIGTVPPSLALLSATISNGTTGVTVLSQCTHSGGGGARTYNIIGSVIVSVGSPSESAFHTNNPSRCLSLIRCICASKYSWKDLP